MVADSGNLSTNPIGYIPVSSTEIGLVAISTLANPHTVFVTKPKDETSGQPIFITNGSVHYGEPPLDSLPGLFEANLVSKTTFFD